MSAPLLDKVVAWASAQDAIRVIILEGSRARRDHTVDRFSDYDLNLYVTDVAQFTGDDAWFAQLAPIWAMEKEVDEAGDPTRLVLFAGGHDIDFKLLPVARLHDFIRQRALPDGYQRGYTVILDKDGLTAQLPPPTYQAAPQKKPGEEEFLYAVNVFWFELFHLVKYLHRGDLWHVKLRDAGIKKRLLQMLEWHAQAAHNGELDTWFAGKYMQSWVQPELWDAFSGIFARFDKEDSWRAVLALIPLYRRLAIETAAHLNYPYPHEMDEGISGFILDNRPV